MAAGQQAVQQGNYAEAERIYQVAVKKAEEISVVKTAALLSAFRNWRRSMPDKANMSRRSPCICRR